MHLSLAARGIAVLPRKGYIPPIDRAWPRRNSRKREDHDSQSPGNAVSCPLAHRFSYQISALLATAGVAVLAMSIATSRALRLDMPSLRRESARSLHRPLWRRLNLDIIALIITAVGYSFFLYLISSDALGLHASLVIRSPLTVLGTSCLLLAGVLLFLRIFPTLLRASARLAARNRCWP
ncbi:MAG: hypothetical protein M3Z08_15620 [Chloroflexota bacterium]|nr:hypothetical protein [Chloroflexota bacterium]